MTPALMTSMRSFWVRRGYIEVLRIALWRVAVSKVVEEEVLFCDRSHFGLHLVEDVVGDRVDLEVLSVLLVDGSPVLEEHLLVDQVPDDRVHEPVGPVLFLRAERFDDSEQRQLFQRLFYRVSLELREKVDVADQCVVEYLAEGHRHVQDLGQPKVRSCPPESAR